MKYRNNWTAKNRFWDRIAIKVKLGAIDFFTVEVDVTREFYMITVLNFTIKNR
jgi:hypothetical protein